MSGSSMAEDRRRQRRSCHVAQSRPLGVASSRGDRRGRMWLRRAVPAAIAVVMTTQPPLAFADKVPDDARWEEATVRSDDGTRLHADVFRPKDLKKGRKTPVIVIVSPYLTAHAGDEPLTRPTILPYYRDLFEVAFRRGYSIVQVALRGQGGSEGCPDLGGKGEQADARAAVKWAASRSWSTGRVGMWGLSYDGLTQIMNLANGVRALRAAVIMGPAIDMYRVFFMNGVPYARSHLITPYYFGLSLIPPALLPPSDRPPFRDGPSSDPHCRKQLQRLKKQTAQPDPTTRFWRERNFIRRARTSRAAVLWSHGFFDEQTYATSFLPVWRKLRGPHRAWFGQFPHVVASEAENGNPDTVGRSGFTAQAFRWLDRHVKGRSRRSARVRRDPVVAVQEGSAGKWRAERQWPPADARPVEMPLRGGDYLDAPGNKAYPGCFRFELSCPPGPSGIGSWSISQSLPYPVHFAGVPQLEVKVSSARPKATLIALIYDIDEDDAAAFVTRGARILPGRGTYRVSLYPQDWRFGKGHRIGVLLAGADDLWFAPEHSGAPVRIKRATLQMPFLRRNRRHSLDGGPSAAVTQRQTFPATPAIAAGWVKDVPLPPRMRGR